MILNLKRVKEENVSLLTARFQSLGFGNEVEAAIRSALCFPAERFEISNAVKREGDECIVTVHIARENVQSDFDCIFYDVVMRKEIAIADESMKLDLRMALVDWQNAYQAKSIRVSKKLPAVETIIEIKSILDELLKIDAAAADQLRFKHWIDTPLETLMPNLSALRYLHEISQRFYFFEEEQPITIDEAYRFLKCRWIEKQLQFRKKETVKAVTEDETSDAKPARGGGKLLVKNKRSRKTASGK